MQIDIDQTFKNQAYIVHIIIYTIVTPIYTLAKAYKLD